MNPSHGRGHGYIVANVLLLSFCFLYYLFWFFVVLLELATPNSSLRQISDTIDLAASGVMVTFFGVGSMVGMIGCAVCMFGLLARKSWARVSSLVLYVYVSLIGCLFPLTSLGWWLLFRADVKAMFQAKYVLSIHRDQGNKYD